MRRTMPVVFIGMPPGFCFYAQELVSAISGMLCAKLNLEKSAEYVLPPLAAQRKREKYKLCGFSMMLPGEMAVEPLGIFQNFQIHRSHSFNCLGKYHNIRLSYGCR